MFSSPYLDRDVAFVGSGVISLTAAIEARKAGAKVRVYDAGSPATFTAGCDPSASPNAFAMILPTSMGFGVNRTRAMNGFDRWRLLARDAKLSATAFNICGWMQCATTQDEETGLREYLASATDSPGIFGVERNAIETVPRFAAHGGTECRYGVFDPNAASVHPLTCLKELIEYARSLGITFVFNHRVTELHDKTATITHAGHTSDVTADVWFVSGGNYTDRLFPEECEKRGFQIRFLEMAESVVRPVGQSIPHLVSGPTTFVRYGHGKETSVVTKVAANISPALRAIDANAMLSPHPFEGGVRTRVGDTHGSAQDGMQVRPGNFRVLTAELLRFVSRNWVPTAEEYDRCWVGRYPYLTDQGPHGEDVVVFKAARADAILMFPATGRGWSSWAPTADAALEAGAALLAS